MFSGRFVGAPEALRLGLIDEMVAPDAVYDSAVDWAARFVATPAAALAGAKALIDAGLDAQGQARRYGEVFAAGGSG
jgi:enoyl-CoA hydratase